MKKAIFTLILSTLLFFGISCATTKEAEVEISKPWYIGGSWEYTASDIWVKFHGDFSYDVNVNFNEDNTYSMRIGTNEYCGEYEYQGELYGDSSIYASYFILKANPEEYKKMTVYPLWRETTETLFWSEYKNDYIWVSGYFPVETANFIFEGMTKSETLYRVEN